MQYIIDRFEGNFAILEAENGEYTGMERARLPREAGEGDVVVHELGCLLYTSPSPRDMRRSRMPSSA